MSLGQHQEAFSRDLVKLLQFAFERGYEVRLGEVLRTTEQQAIYLKTGRSKTMNSMHLKKCAADLHFTQNGNLVYPQELGTFWESLNALNSWGGNWKSFHDAAHFERRV
jgi:peptidoglycan L-alanyl-D-glutamate endopeptidase CwlK